jgi:hypothetical protein
MQFHHCVYENIRWLQGEHAQGREVDEYAALTRLVASWEAKGPNGHPYEKIYWQHAEAFVIRALKRFLHMKGQTIRPVWEVPLKHGHVRFVPDSIEIREGQKEPSMIIRRLRTGRPSQSEHNKDIYALYHEGARHMYPLAKHKVELISLSTDQQDEVRLTPKKIETRLARYDAAIAGILQQEFPALPNDRECPRCPHYFICPVTEE